MLGADRQLRPVGDAVAEGVVYPQEDGPVPTEVTRDLNEVVAPG